MVGAESLEILRCQILGSKDQDGYVCRRLSAPDLFQHLKPVDLGHHQIEDNPVGDGMGHVIKGILPASGHVGTIPGCFDNVSDLDDGRLVVLDEQNPGQERFFTQGGFRKAPLIGQYPFYFRKQCRRLGGAFSQNGMGIAPQLLPVCFRQVLGRDDDDGQVAGIGVTANPLKDGEAVGIGHHQIENQDVGCAFLHQFETGSAVLGHDGHQSFLFDDPSDLPAVQVVVVDDHD